MFSIPTSSPTDIQNEIIEEFHIVAEDRSLMLQYLMELGERLPPLEERYKIEDNKIQGCMSTVWLVGHNQTDRIFFEADSNTAITKGLISLLIRIFSGQTATSILSSELYFLDKIGLANLIGSQRSNGLVQMIRQI